VGDSPRTRRATATQATAVAEKLAERLLEAEAGLALSRESGSADLVRASESWLANVQKGKLFADKAKFKADLALYRGSQ
jgi:hypothetical protein